MDISVNAASKSERGSPPPLLPSEGTENPVLFAALQPNSHEEKPQELTEETVQNES